jgi:hypothetical protein
MKATGALPTEERVQRMSEVQWLYCYYNIRKDEEEEEIKWKARLDYLGLYIRPEVARSVIESDMKREQQEQNGDVSTSRTTIEKKKVSSIVSDDGSTEYVTLDTDVNASFEEELKRAMEDAGLSTEELTELPDSQNAGNPYESQDDFISRALGGQNLAGLKLEDAFGEVPVGFESREDYIAHLHSEQNLVNVATQEEEKQLTEEEIYRQYGIDPDDIDIIEVPE